MLSIKPPLIKSPSVRFFLGFVEHNNSRYAVVRTTRNGLNGSTTNLEVIARIIRGGKARSLTPANEMAKASAGEKALIYLPPEFGGPVSAWSIIQPGADLHFYRKHIYYVIEVPNPDEAMRVARSIIATHRLYRNDEAVPPVNLHNMHIPSVSQHF